MSGSIQDSSESFYRRSLEIDFPIEVMSLFTARYAEAGVAEVCNVTIAFY